MAYTSPTRKLLGWLVHLLTATGLLFALYCVYCIAHGQYQTAIGLLLITIVIDAVDGPLARKVNVKEHIADFDGTLLDNIVDFITWVFLPSYFLIESQLLPLYPATICAGAILLCSSYQFCCTDVKDFPATFKRFPSAWSLVIITTYIWQIPESITIGFISVAFILSFVPIYYVHPFQPNIIFRHDIFRALLILFSVAFLGSIGYAIYSYPNVPTWLIFVQQACIVLHFVLSLVQTGLYHKRHKEKHTFSTHPS